MRCSARPLLCRPPRQRISLTRPKQSPSLPARNVHTQPQLRTSIPAKLIDAPEVPGKFSAAPLILLAAVALQVANDDDDDDKLALGSLVDRDARDPDAPAPFRETFMRLKVK